MQTAPKIRCTAIVQNFLAQEIVPEASFPSPFHYFYHHNKYAK